jgi:hypothetical protein
MYINSIAAMFESYSGTNTGSGYVQISPVSCCFHSILDRKSPATASTLLNESWKWNPDAIERSLACAGKDAVPPP